MMNKQEKCKSQHLVWHIYTNRLPLFYHYLSQNTEIFISKPEAIKTYYPETYYQNIMDVFNIIWISLFS